jgi:hypothetical protein
MHSGLLILSFLFLSPKQDTTVKDRIGICFFTKKYTAKKLTKDIVGSWKLTRQKCFWTQNKNVPTPKVIVTFSSKGQYSILEDSVTIKIGKWNIQSRNKRLLLEFDDSPPYLSSNILLCKDEFYFNEMGSDGCECLYTRIK